MKNFDIVNKQIEVFVKSYGTTVTMVVVGEYGDNPIVTWLGHEMVAEYCYIDSNGNRVSSVCTSRGCDYCNGYCLGCRYSAESKGYSCMPYLEDLPDVAVNPVSIQVTSPSGDVETFPIRNDWDILSWIEYINLYRDTEEFQVSTVRYYLNFDSSLIGECDGAYFDQAPIFGHLWETEAGDLLDIISKTSK